MVPCNIARCSQDVLGGCRYFKLVQQINEREPYLRQLTDEDLKAKTAEFRYRLSKGASLDELLVEAFAVVREVSSRVLRLRHYDAQMVSNPSSLTAHMNLGQSAYNSTG